MTVSFDVMIDLMSRIISAGLVIALLALALLFIWQPVIHSQKQLGTVPLFTGQTTSTISGIVVPHHDLVKDQRAQLFAKLGKVISAPETIILVSPNHYSSGQGLIQTRQEDWAVASGIIEANTEVITSLIAHGVTEEPGSFGNEHGIKVILPDIEATFPHAKIVPILIKDGLAEDKITELHDVLDETCRDCLLITSVDFSHYQPALLANLHDNLTKRSLEQLDTGSLLTEAEVDSTAGLALLATWAKSHGTERFVTKQQTNSGELAASSDIETTTHLFGWYEKGEQVKSEPAVSFALGGDMMFGRSIAHTFLKDGLWKSLDQLGNRLFWGTDAAVVNLEGPVSEVPVPGDIRPDNLIFNFPPETIEALKYLKVNAVSLGNNHSANAGSKGLETTHRLLDEAGIAYFGGPSTTDAARTSVFVGHELNLHVIGFQTLERVPDIAKHIQEIKKDPKNRVLIFPHWGNEYQYQHSKQQENLARGWIDAGADIVIGAHPHVIQDSEFYKGKPIIYSLGNLLFDQTFSKETQQGLIMAGEFTRNGLSLFALPVQSVKLKPSLIRGESKQQLLDRLYEPFEVHKKAGRAGTLLFFPA